MASWRGSTGAAGAAAAAEADPAMIKARADDEDDDEAAAEMSDIDNKRRNQDVLRKSPTNFHTVLSKKIEPGLYTSTICFHD